MGVGVDREQASGLERDRDELVRWVFALGSRVDLHGDPVRRARVEHRAGVEGRGRARPALPRDEPPRDVTEHVDAGVGCRRDEPARHRRGIHPQFRVRGGDHDVELAERGPLPTEPHPEVLS